MRGEVRRLGSELGGVRWKTALVWLIPAALMLPFIAAPDDGLGVAVRRLWAGALLGAMVALAILSALPLSSGRGSLRYEELKNDLAELPLETVAAVLLPLREGESGDVRRLARALIRDLRVPTEIAPADPTLGRGNEPAAC